jgi:hypothetical protein
MSALNTNLTLTKETWSGRCILPILVLTALALVFAVPTVTGQCQVEKLMAPGHTALDDFGAAVAIEGDYAVIADRCGTSTGEVFAFVKTSFGWVNTEILFPIDPCDAQEFGHSVAMSGQTLLVGAPGDDDLGGGVGAVYVYFRDERGTSDAADDVWLEVGKLYPTGPVLPTRYGEALALDGNLAAIGAPGTAMQPAAVFVLLRDDNGTPIFPFDDAWYEETVLVPDGGSVLTEFGTALSLDDPFLLIGDTRDDAAGINSGAVYVYMRNVVETPVRWFLDDKWIPFIDNDFNEFGSSVDLDGEFAVVGSPGDAGGTDGRVYVYERDASTKMWPRQVALNNPTAFDWASFGTAVAASDGRVLASAPLMGFLHYSGGRVWMFEKSGETWLTTMDFQAADEQLGDYFGTALDVSGEALLVGAPGFAGLTEDLVSPVVGSGAMLALDLVDPWIDHGFGLTDDVPEPRICGWGVMTEGWPVSLKLYQAPPSALGGLVVGFSTLFTPFKGGTLVPSPDLILPVFADGFGEAYLSAGWVPDGMLPARMPIYFQHWIIDPTQAPAGWAATNALEVRTP